MHCLPTSRHPLTLLLSCIVVVVDFIIAFVVVVVVVVVVVIVFDNYIVVCCLFGLPTCNLFSSSSHATPFVSLVVVGINCLVVVAGLLLFVSLLFLLIYLLLSHKLSLFSSSNLLQANLFFLFVRVQFYDHHLHNLKPSSYY